MKVFKFGGASVNSVERVKNLAAILRSCPDEKILVVVSAMGKTTNALEKVTEAFYQKRKEEALQLFEAVKQNHLNTAKYLLVTTYKEALARLTDFFTEVEWLLYDEPLRDYDYYYDQIVCTGELFSTTIISAWLKECGIAHHWIDVRDVLRTDDNFRDANVDWAYTRQRTEAAVLPLFDTAPLVITQGFIGCTDENESTTLGREGSDYTAAIFAYLLDAESQTLWKDVPGVMNADPKQFPDAERLDELSYDEAIKMTYYGAQVIHPKTIKPLENKNIPLYVKCFLDPSLPGTIIHRQSRRQLPPIIVLKDQQVLLQFHSKDFSFVGEKPIGELYHLLADNKIKPNLLQTGAVTILLCVDDRPERIERLAFAASDIFDVQIERGLTLLTIRHHEEALTTSLINGRTIELKQQSPETVQVLMR